MGAPILQKKGGGLVIDPRTGLLFVGTTTLMGVAGATARPTRRRFGQACGRPGLTPWAHALGSRPVMDPLAAHLPRAAPAGTQSQPLSPGRLGPNPRAQAEEPPEE